MKYTKKQIDSMTPEELKRAVATDVMGLSIYHYGKDYEANCYVMLVDENFESVASFDGITTGERKTEEEAWKDCPDYSGDISAAWEIVEKFGEMLVRRRLGGTDYRAWIQIDLYGKREVYSHGKTAPEAICKAALLAVME